MPDMSPSTICALYNVYHDDIWLPFSYKSIYDSVDGIYFFVNDHPWAGENSDNTSTLKCIKDLPDPKGKKEIVFGSWCDEIDQRNSSLASAIVAGYQYGMIVDADEIYEQEVLNNMLRHATSFPEVDVWHMNWFTYWKTHEYRIAPPEPYQPPVLTRLGTAGFAETRNLLGKEHRLIPPDVGMCHHMSYARSNELIRRKLSMFSHAHQIIPGWFENVWLAWDSNKEMQNLHPVIPSQYLKAVRQPNELLPSVLRSTEIS